jgi:uncharacterized protein with GYD domain
VGSLFPAACFRELIYHPFTKLVGSWYCFGDYDLAIIADVPNNESMAAIALAIAAGGALKSAKTTVLMTGAEAVAAMKKADAVAKVYKPAR